MEISNRKLLEDRIRLLSRGVTIPPIKWWKPVRHLQSFFGGPGPQGRPYYICYNNDDTPVKMISLPVFPKNYYLAKYAISSKRSNSNPHDLITKDEIVLKGVPSPSSWDKVLSNGKLISRSGLFRMHCYNTYAMTLSMACSYFEMGEQCKFCTLDYSKFKKWGMPKRHSNETLLEALKLTLECSKVRSITVTSGTYPDSDTVAKELIILLKKINQFTDIPIHVQVEPVVDTGLLKELSGIADSVGIFLEIFDENIRRQICPGKARASKERYIKAWKDAVEYFGWGKVLTTCFLGFGEDFNKILTEIEECIKLGVRVIILLVRVGSKSLGKKFIPSYIGKEEELIDFHIKVAEILLQNNMEAKINGGSGCIGCQGCSAMVEACEYVKSTI